MDERLRAYEKAYGLKTHMDRWQNSLQPLQEALPEKETALRQARVALAEYEADGLTALLHRLRGTREEKLREKRLAVKRAQTALEAANREIQNLQGKLEEAREALEALGLPEPDPDREPEGSPLRRLEVLLLARRLAPSLEQLRRSLTLARDAAQARLRPEQFSDEVFFKHLEKVEKAARDCRECLLRLREWGMGLSAPAWLENLSGFVSGTAQEYGRLDRLNAALGQVRDMEAGLEELLLQLET